MRYKLRIMRYKLSQWQTYEPFANKLDDSLNRTKSKDLINMQDFRLSCTQLYRVQLAVNIVSYCALNISMYITG